MEKVEYRNIHTGELVRIRRSEVVRSNPSDFAVYVLSDGTRWQIALFNQHHEEVTTTKVKKS